MRSRSAEPSTAALLVLAIACGGCRSEHFTSPLEANIPIVGSGVLCLGREGVDTYVIDVFTLDADGVERPENGTLCSLCALGDPRVRCEHVARQCLCSAPRDSAQEIEEALLGVRFESLPPDRSLCARLLLLDRFVETGTTEGPADACPDIPQCALDADLTRARLCALTDAFAVSPAQTSVGFDEYACSAGLTMPADGGTALSCELLEERCRRGIADACDNLRLLCADAGRPGGGLGALDVASCASF